MTGRWPWQTPSDAPPVRSGATKPNPSPSDPPVVHRSE
jgi:hypothetical protein